MSNLNSKVYVCGSFIIGSGDSRVVVTASEFMRELKRRKDMQVQERKSSLLSAFVLIKARLFKLAELTQASVGKSLKKDFVNKLEKQFKQELSDILEALGISLEEADALSKAFAF